MSRMADSGIEEQQAQTMGGHTVIKNGDLVRDSITGFEGIVIGDTTWLNGCRRLMVQCKELRDGKPLDSFSFDVEQLVLVTQSASKVSLDRPGGPRVDPARQRDPVR